MKRLFVAAALAAAIAMPAAGLQAKTLRWASQGDILTFDPHAQNEGLNNTAMGYVYESLLNYDEKFQLIEGLATSWRNAASWYSPSTTAAPRAAASASAPACTASKARWKWPTRCAAWNS